MTQPSEVSTIEQLEPAAVWRLFGGIAAVPRPSKREERIRAHVRRVAEDAGWAVREDAAGNLVIQVAASPGRENAPVIVLQGHLDMVCEKNSGTEHDFDNDPIRTIVEQSGEDGDLLVRADGTTLGADNGMGVALALAAAGDPDIVHGPLEILCTIDEEAGMSGAKALEPDFFTGRCLLNLDSEEDDVLYIGCAGGCDVMLTWNLTTGPIPTDVEVCRVTVAGLRGGHSGGDIHLNRANAIKLLAQTLTAGGVSGLQLADCKGGSLRNAIPREAWAVVAGPAGTMQTLTQAAEAVQAEGHRNHGEPNCRVTVEKLSPASAPAALSTTDTHALLTALAALPHGVLAVVPEIPGLVQTSNNVATLVIEAGPTGGGLRITVGCLPRSSSADQLHATTRQIRAAGQLAGAAVGTANEYPGWQPDVDSSVLATCRAVYQRLFKEAPNVTAIHAGLECGLIGERVPGMDMVSFGPRIEGAHSPDERVYVASVQKSWKYLTAVLAELAQG
ncbi:MAG: aminoacyl-histidine dipeptidase [bacterium]|nr:aminoacyl-histidine dipeptidase [bacterium]